MIPSIEKIAAILGGDVQGDQVLCPGPGHGVGDRSLSVKPDKDDAEGFVVHSFADDDFKACRDHVRTKLGLPEFKKDGGGKAWRLISEHVYLDKNGERFLKVRKCIDADGKKQYPQYHWDGNGWAKGKPDEAKIPYRLPQLIAASPATTIVYFVEGEKDADNLSKLGFVATTASEGAAAKWDSALTRHFKDRHVVILPDADKPGRKHAQKVAQAIDTVAASVRVLDLYPERHDGSDVSNWLADDTAGAKLAKLAKQAPLWESGGTTDTSIDGEIDHSEGAARREKVDRSEGAALLADVGKFLARFVIYPSEHAYVAHVLWIAHAHLMDAWESTPRIAFLSPEPASGKTRSMEVTELLVPEPVAAVNVTPAYLFRKVGGEDGPPTILFDEIDTVFGAKAKEHEELRALLNSGHRRGAVAGRCVVRGATVETEEIPSYSAVALAGLGWLPDTILTRSVIVRMRRRAPDEKIEAFRRRVQAPIGEALRRRLAGWAATILAEATEARPDMPAGVEDRDADLWEALLAVADIAGGDWSKRAREAAKALVAMAREIEPSLNIRLLADLRAVFGIKEQLTTKEILAALHELEDAPWGDLRGKPLSDNQLARRLKQYDVKSKTLRVGKDESGKDHFAKGYERADLHDAWRRYLPPPPSPDKPVTAVTPVTTQLFQGLGATAGTAQASSEPSRSPSDSMPVTTSVTPCDGSAEQRNPNKTWVVTPVTPVTPLAGNGSAKGLSSGTRRQLADLARAHADSLRHGGADLNLDAIEGFVRERVEAAGTDPDQVEPEVGAIMGMLFQ
jgi:5S rRNA maturation endonuclease (ribonuclease M5)